MTFDPGSTDARAHAEIVTKRPSNVDSPLVGVPNTVSVYVVIRWSGVVVRPSWVPVMFHCGPVAPTCATVDTSGKAGQTGSPLTPSPQAN